MAHCRYRKVVTKVWADEKFRKLSAPKPNAQTLWLYLLTGPHTGIIPGLTTAGAAGLAEALGWPLAAFRRCYQEIAALGMAEADWSARVLYLPKALSHNEPESPSVVKEWARSISEIADCPLKQKAVTAIAAYLRQRGPAWLAAWVTPDAGTQPNQHKRHAASQPGGQPASQAASHQEQEQERTTLSGSARQLTEPSLNVPEGSRAPDGSSSNGHMAEARKILEHLNRVTRHSYKPVEANLRLIEARLSDGATRETCLGVVDAKANEWLGTEQEKYLRPKTLFNATNFAQYEGQLGNGGGPASAALEDPYKDWPHRFDCEKCGESHEFKPGDPKVCPRSEVKR